MAYNVEKSKKPFAPHVALDTVFHKTEANSTLLGGWRQEHQEFKVILGYRGTLSVAWAM